MKRILIALDYDPTAQRVAESGVALSFVAGDEVTLLHVIENPAFYASSEYDPIMGFVGYMRPELPGALGMDQIKWGMEDYLQKSKEHLQMPEMQTRIEEGLPGEVILSAASDIKADLIVMGTHSRRWLEKIIMGSIAGYVVQHSRIPLLIIPTRQ